MTKWWQCLDVKAAAKRRGRHPAHNGRNARDLRSGSQAVGKGE
jgi:hypothetical protein